MDKLYKKIIKRLDECYKKKNIPDIIFVSRVFYISMENRTYNHSFEPLGFQVIEYLLPNQTRVRFLPSKILKEKQFMFGFIEGE
jgi:hypothetical protein